MLNYAVLESNTGARVGQEGEILNRSLDLSVIIVSWNVKALLQQCLRSLRSPEVSEGLRMEIIVVDNASADGTAEWAQQHGDVRLVESGTNLGYGRACNIGLSLARGRHLMVLNPDTQPQAGSLRKLQRLQERHPRAGIVAPRLFNPDGTVQRAAFRFPSLLMHLLDLFPLPEWLPGRLRLWLRESSLNGRYSQEVAGRKPFRIDHPLGACLLLAREAYEQVGGFDPAIFMYSEEIDLALRYKLAGWECWQVPAARVVHLGGQSTAQVPDRMQRELWRSRVYLYRKHYSRAAVLALSCLIISRQVYDLLKVNVASLTGKVSSAEKSRVRSRVRDLIRVALGK